MPSSAVPPLPGAMKSSSHEGDSTSAVAMAHSRRRYPEEGYSLVPSSHDGLVAIGTDRDDADGHAGELLEMFHVIASLLGQLGVRAATGDIALPAGHLLVDGLGVMEGRLLTRDVFVDDAIGFVGRANLDLVDGAEHVELGERDVGEAVDVGGIADDDGIVPTATTLTPRGDANLVGPASPRILPYSSKSSVGNGPLPTRVI